MGGSLVPSPAWPMASLMSRLLQMVWERLPPRLHGRRTGLEQEALAPAQPLTDSFSRSDVSCYSAVCSGPLCSDSGTKQTPCLGPPYFPYRRQRGQESNIYRWGKFWRTLSFTRLQQESRARVAVFGDGLAQKVTFEQNFVLKEVVGRVHVCGKCLWSEGTAHAKVLR